MATAPCPFPFSVHAASTPFSVATTYPPPPASNSPIPTQIHGYHPSPFPFFSPPPPPAPTPTLFTAPMYAPTSDLPPPSMATSPSNFPFFAGPCPYAYPPPQHPGGHYGAPLAGLCAATYPSTLPSATVAPYSGLFPSPIPSPTPAQPYRPSWPPPAPDSSPSTSASAPSPFPAPPWQSPGHYLPPDPPPCSQFHSPPPCYLPSPPPCCLPSPPAGFFPPPGYGSSTDPYTTTQGEQLVSKHTGLEILSKASNASDHRYASAPKVPVEADETDLVTDATLHQLQQQERDQNFKDIQGQLATIASMVSEFAKSLGKQSILADASKLERSQQLSTGSAAPASVVSQMFGELPTPSYCNETDVTAPHYFSGHHDPIQSTFVCNLSEQNLDGRPQANGLHNLNCKSAVPEPMFAVYDESDSSSTESVPLFTDTPEKLTGEEDNPETEHTSPCLDIISDVSDSTLELQQQDDEMECNSPVTKASDSTATRSSQLSIEHSMRELRLIWDPGASTFLVTTLNNGSSSDTIGNEHVVGRLVSSTGGLSFHDNTDLGSQYEQLCIVLPGVFNEVMLDIPPTKPPESKQFSALQAIYGTRFLLEAIPSWQKGVFSLGSLAISALRRTSTPTGDKIYGCLYTAAKSQNLLPCISTRDTEHICIFVKLSPWSIRSAQHFQNSAMKKGSTFPTECTLSWNPWYAILLLSQFLWEFSMEQETQMPWDRRQATIAMTCEHATTCWGIVCMAMHCCSTTVYVTQHMHALEFSLMVTMLPNGSESTDGQLAYMPQGASSGSSEWARPMVIALSCWFPSFEMAKLQYPGIGTPSSIYLLLQDLTARIATEKPLSWLRILELPKWQSQMTSVSFVWDPGTMLPIYKSKWWLLFKCYGVALWLIHLQPP